MENLAPAQTEYSVINKESHHIKRKQFKSIRCQKHKDKVMILSRESPKTNPYGILDLSLKHGLYYHKEHLTEVESKNLK